MGDGPAYDHMYSEMEKKHARELRDMRARYDALEALRRTVGFGHPRKYDHEFHIPEMIRLRLEEALELMEFWIARHDRRPSDE